MDWVGFESVTTTFPTVLGMTQQSFVVDTQGPNGSSFTLPTQILQTVSTTSYNPITGNSPTIVSGSSVIINP
jgi:hypothetical protein